MAPPRKARRMALAKEGKAQRTAAPGAPVGAYPTDTPGRARSAKSRASHAENVGRISPATEHSIDHRADKELGHAGRHGGVVKPSAPGRIGHSKPATATVESDRGTFRMK